MTDEPVDLGTKEALYRRAKPASLKKRYAGLPAETQVVFWDATIRRNISYWIMGLFGFVNLITMGFIVWLAVEDQNELAAKIIMPTDRVVDNQVLMTLLGATTVQLGTIAVIMARFVFRGG
jgi:hypothetical protein